MIHYFYRGSIALSELMYDKDRKSPQYDPRFFAKLYALAGKYHIPGMKFGAKLLFGRALRCARGSDTFAPAIQIVYTSVPEADKALKRTAVKTVAEHAIILLAKPDVQAVLREFPDFTFDVLMCIRDGMDASARDEKDDLPFPSKITLFRR